MKRRTYGATLVLLAILSLAGWALQYPVTVSTIEIEGTVEIKDKDVLDVIDFEVGDAVSESDLRTASQAVFDLGWFSEVAPEVGENSEITFHVVENPVIHEIVITGNTHRKWYSAFGLRLFRLPIISTPKIRQILRDGDVKKGSVLNRAALETALSDVITEYGDRGYALVALGDVEIGETLRIEIIEARIAANAISGLVTIPLEVAKELIDVPLGEPLQTIDVQTVLSRLGQSVYFTDVGVVPQPGPEPDSVVLQWNLEERDLIQESVPAKDIVLQGISCHAEDAVYAALGEIPTEPIDNYGLLQVLEGVYNLYSDAGYMMVRFAVEGIDNGTLLVRIEEGRVSEIVLNGTERTKDYVILRRLDIEEGRILNRADYLASHQSLTSLGYFQSVDIVPEWVEDGVRVSVTVNERTRLGGVEGSMALDPNSGGVVGKLKLHEKNLFGTGQDVSLSFSRGLVGEEEPRAVTWDLAYTSVAFFPGFDQVGLDLYRTTQEITEDEEASSVVTYGVRTSFAYPVADYVDLGLTYKHEEERIAEETSWTPTDSVTMGLTYDDVNDAYFPTDGTRRSVTVEKAGGFSAGREYFNLGLNWVQFTPAELPLFGSMRQAVGVRFKVGWGDNQLPTSQYYELGGSGSVRGMDSSSVPRMFVANVEHRVELAEDGLYMTTFLDTGIDLDAVRLDAILSTGGIEFGVNAAGIFVRLDVAWSLSSEWSWVPRFDIGFGRIF
jgi:outer membrane protein insertion porin family